MEAYQDGCKCQDYSILQDRLNVIDGTIGEPSSSRHVYPPSYIFCRIFDTATKCVAGNSGYKFFPPSIDMEHVRLTDYVERAGRFQEDLMDAASDIKLLNKDKRSLCGM